jgi:hypothetical protein
MPVIDFLGLISMPVIDFLGLISMPVIVFRHHETKICSGCRRGRKIHSESRRISTTSWTRRSGADLVGYAGPRWRSDEI